MPDFLDIVSISMLINNKQTIISGIYKSPNSDIKRFSDFIYNNFSDFSVKGDLFLVGDFNVNILIKIVIMIISLIPFSVWVVFH